MFLFQNQLHISMSFLSLRPEYLLPQGPFLANHPNPPRLGNLNDPSFKTCSDRCSLNRWLANSGAVGGDAAILLGHQTSIVDSVACSAAANRRLAIPNIYARVSYDDIEVVSIRLKVKGIRTTVVIAGIATRPDVA